MSRGGFALPPSPPQRRQWAWPQDRLPGWGPPCGFTSPGTVGAWSCPGSLPDPWEHWNPSPTRLTPVLSPPLGPSHTRSHHGLPPRLTPRLVPARCVRIKGPSWVPPSQRREQSGGALSLSGSGALLFPPQALTSFSHSFIHQKSSRAQRRTQTPESDCRAGILAV